MTSTTEHEGQDRPVLALTGEQRALGESVRGVLSRLWDPRSLLDQEELPNSAAIAGLWRKAAADIGLGGLTIPVELGGLGASAVDLSVVAEEFGRALCPAPLLSVLGLAVPLLLPLSSDPVPGALLQNIQDDGTVLAAAPPTSTAAIEVDRVGGPGDRVRVSGALNSVLDAEVADQLLLTIRPPGSPPQLLAVDLSASGVHRTPLTSLDLSRSYADLRFEKARAIVVGTLAGRASPWPGTSAKIIVACEAVGVAARVLEIAVDYAKTRVAFGQPIGAFQAVKHRCSRMLIAVEQARSLARYAAWHAGQGHSGSQGAETAAEEALWYANETAIQATADLIRVLGGIGFTWEHVAHLYFRRARAASLLFGDQIMRQERLAERLMA